MLPLGSAVTAGGSEALTYAVSVKKHGAGP